MATTMPSNKGTQSTFQQREELARQQRAAEFDRYAPERERWVARNAAYYRAIERLVAFCVPPGATVLEIGCGTGDLLSPFPPPEPMAINLSPTLTDHPR